VRDRLDRFGDATIAVVTFAAPERLAEYRDHLRLPFAVLADPERRLYDLLGAGRGATRQVWSIGTLRRYVRLVGTGRRLRWPTEDIHQLGADAVIGRDGRLRYLALPAGPDLRPPVEALLAALD